MREDLVIEDVSELAIEVWPVVIGDLEHAVFDAEGVAVVRAEWMAGKFWNPVGQVVAVEQTHPLLRIALRECGTRQ